MVTDEILLTIPDQAETYENPMVEVSSGSPALLGIAMPDGTPAVEGSAAYMSPADCEEYADSIGTSYNPNSEQQ